MQSDTRRRYGDYFIIEFPDHAHEGIQAESNTLNGVITNDEIVLIRPRDYSSLSQQA